MAINQNKPFPSLEIDVIGHRGQAGNFPENSIPAFLDAVEGGVNGLEMDVVISRDKKVVVSHEAFMASDYMLTPNKDLISPKDEYLHKLYDLDYDVIRQYILGAIPSSQFPNQKRIPTYKPLLTEVIDKVEGYIQENDLPPITYYIELKSDPKEYGIFQPHPAEFIELVCRLVQEKKISRNVVLMSFDPILLNELRFRYPDIPVSYLVPSGDIDQNLSFLKFLPEIYGPNYKLVNPTLIERVKSRGMKLLTWTVNEPGEMKQMIDWKVDGIISDYPERLMKLLD